jgi:hypothetical protein
MGPRLVLALALPLAGVAGCGDDGGDGGGGSGSIGDRYVASIDGLTETACDCFGELGFASRGACIDATGFADETRRMCLGDTIDGTAGTDARYECLLDANRTFERCVDAAGCDGAADCAVAFEEETGICPALSSGVSQTFNASFAECVGGDVMPGTCPEIMSNAGIGGSITGSTLGMADDYSFPGAEQCVAHGSGAPDVTIRWTVPADGDYSIRFNMENTDFRPVLLQIAGCDDLTVQACADGTNFGGFTFMGATAGATATFVVDGLGQLDEGNFQIDVVAPEG